MSIFLELRSLFKPVTSLQLATKELAEAKQGVAHAKTVREYAKRELLRIQSLAEYAEASIAYNLARVERLEVAIRECELTAVQQSKVDYPTDCTNPLS